MEKENTNMQMAQYIKEIGVIIKYQDMEFILGLMVRIMKGNGLIIICMDKAFTDGLMDENMKVNMLMTKRKDTVYTYILMVGLIKDNGIKVNSTAKAYLCPLRDKKEEELGRMAKE